MMASHVTYDRKASARKNSVLVSERERREQNVEYWLDIALEDSFPCSDPISSMRAD
ncbi:MAG TPA: hypothetical protein VMU69_00915 [Bradyrhizobium sp.]|nr:hypothetical protein [Bradyrhizobium sp.]